MDCPDPTLAELLQEMVEARRNIHQVLKFSPEDVQLHRIHGMYAGQILDIRPHQSRTEENPKRNRVNVKALGITNRGRGFLNKNKSERG